jgi:branched-chain amino acid transport system substrate-binding protein
MNLPHKDTRPKKDRIWLLSIVAILVLAAQCQQTPPTPPIPVAPAGPVIRVAILSPIQGELATVGRMMRSGTVLAFEQANDQGGILDHRIEWVLYHTECQFDTTTEATRQAIDDGHQFIIGPLCSDAAIAAAEVAAEAGVLMIAPAATHPLVTVNSQGLTRSTVFRASYAYPAQGQAMARFAYETLQARRAALVLDPGDDYSTSLSQAFADLFDTLGGEVLHRVLYHPGELNFSESLVAIQDADVEVIYLPATAPVVNQVATQLNELAFSQESGSTPSRPILLGSDSWQSPELDLTVTEGSYFASHFVPADPQPAVQTWIEAYKAAYAVEPDTLAALGYDAAALLVQATRQAGTFEPIAVAAILEQETFDGVTGSISFDNHHNPVKPIPIVHIRDNQIILTSP